jgi:hypothetical protein
MPNGYNSAREARNWSRPRSRRKPENSDKFECSLLGVSVSYLENEFIKEVESHFGVGADPNYHDIKDKMLVGSTAKGKGLKCPRDGLLDCSYVDTLSAPNVGKSNVMLSWCWSSTVRTVVTALSQWCHKARRDPEDVFVWQCALCHNHFRDAHAAMGLLPPGEMKPATARKSEPAVSRQEMAPATVRFSEPLLTCRDMVAPVYDSISRFQWRLRAIGTLLVILSPLTSPMYLRRIWCLFEFFTSCVGQQGNVHILLSEADEAVFKKSLLAEGFSKLHESITQVDIKAADTTISRDVEGILRLLRADIRKRASLTNDDDASSVAKGSLPRGQVAYSARPASPGRDKAHAAGATRRAQSARYHRELHSDSCEGTPLRDTRAFLEENGSELASLARPELQEKKQAEEEGQELVEPELAVINREIAEVFKRWLFDKAQSELQQLASQGWVPLEAFANVAGLLCKDKDFEPLGFLVLQQGLRFGQATNETDGPGYALLLREMGACLSKQGRHQQALSHFLASRSVYESGQMYTSPDYVELLTCITQNAVAAASSRVNSMTSSVDGADSVMGGSNLMTSMNVPPLVTSPSPLPLAYQRHTSQDVSILQEPLNDFKSAFICMPSCQSSTAQADLNIIDLQREDSGALAQVVPVLPIAKETPTDYHADDHHTGVVDFGQLMKDRSQLTTDRRHHSDRRVQEPEEPADVGVLDMLVQWASKIGTSWNSQRDGGVPALLQGCRNRTTIWEEERI